MEQKSDLLIENAIIKNRRHLAVFVRFFKTQDFV